MRILDLLEQRILWLLVFIGSSLLRSHVIIQILLFLIMVLGLNQIRNLLIYWIFRLSKVSEIPLPWGTLKLPIETPGELPFDPKYIGADDETISRKLLVKAVQTFSAGNPQEAVALAEAALERYPNNYDATTFLGFIYDLAPVNRPEKAVQYNKRALALRPRAFLPQFNLAVAMNHVEGPQKSLDEFLRAEEYAKGEKFDMDAEIMGKLNLFLADDLKNTGRLEEAKARYKRAGEILAKLAAKGDRTSQHWLVAARKRYQELQEKERDHNE